MKSLIILQYSPVIPYNLNNEHIYEHLDVLHVTIEQFLMCLVRKLCFEGLLVFSGDILGVYAYLTYFPCLDFLGHLVCCSRDLREMHCGGKKSIAICSEFGPKIS